MKFITFTLCVLVAPVALFAMHDYLKPSKECVKKGDEFYITAELGTHIYAIRDAQSRDCVEYKGVSLAQPIQEKFTFIAKKPGHPSIICEEKNTVLRILHHFMIRIN